MPARRVVLPLLFASAAGLIAVFGFFFFRDNFSTHYPIKVISARIFRVGEIPYWNFYDGGGQPLAGNPNTLTFYPDNFLYLILPASVAFNLHFILHLVAAWFAMRALSGSRPAAWLYVLSGVAISATAFYNLIAAIALIPLAFLAAHRRSPLLLGLSFGLLALAGEPVVMIAAAIGVAILLGRTAPKLWAAVPIAIVIALPQLIAYGEIANEVERAHRFSTQTVLNTSLPPSRLLEFVIGPFLHAAEPRLFLSLFVGLIVIPAVVQRSRYVLIAAVMLFFALGRFNPLIVAAVDAFPSIRVARFPEKFVIAMTIALVVLAAKPLANRVWQVVTFVPLVLWAAFTLPIDWFSPYRTAPQPQWRIYLASSPGGQEPSRTEYRARAARLEPMFGATAGLRYAVDRSPDGMFSLMTRIAAERYAATRNVRWLRIAGCSNAPGALPRAMFVPHVIGTRSVREAVEAIEKDGFDERSTAVGPADMTSPPDARVNAIREGPQELQIDVSTSARAVLLVNETYFRGWVAGGLQTLPLDLDRLGVVVPPGNGTIILRFGRHRLAVAGAWFLSSLVLLGSLLSLRIEKLNRGAGEIERSTDEDRALS
jgi:hypothetical protein